MIGYARFEPAMRYYCWAPYDSQNEYTIETTVNGAPLTAAQIEERYRIPAVGVNPRMIRQVTDIVSYVEDVYRRSENATAKVRYKTNGGEEKVWLWQASSAP